MRRWQQETHAPCDETKWTRRKKEKTREANGESGQEPQVKARARPYRDLASRPVAAHVLQLVDQVGDLGEDEKESREPRRLSGADQEQRHPPRAARLIENAADELRAALREPEVLGAYEEPAYLDHESLQHGERDQT